jgi:hypothetical protein
MLLRASFWEANCETGPLWLVFLIPINKWINHLQ